MQFLNQQHTRMAGHVYIMASRMRGTLYIGVTSDLLQRVHEHKEMVYPKSFTARYGIKRLVWFDEYEDIEEAIGQEKRWRRAWKIQLIEKANPKWLDLHETLY